MEWLWTQWRRLCMGPIPWVPLNQNQSIGDYLETNAEWTVRLSHWTIVPHTRQGSFFMELASMVVNLIFILFTTSSSISSRVCTVPNWEILNLTSVLPQAKVPILQWWACGPCMYALMILSSYHMTIHWETVNLIEQQNTFKVSLKILAQGQGDGVLSSRMWYMYWIKGYHMVL